MSQINVENLEGLIDAVRDDPAKGATVWKAETVWKGGFKSEARIRDFTVEMDEPEGLGGGDSAPNMVEVVLGAYGSCLTTGYSLNAHRLGIPVEDIRVELEGDLDLQGFFHLKEPEQVPAGYSAIRVKVTLTAPKASDADLKRLHEEVMKTSPVGSILERPIPIETKLQIANR